MKHFSYTVLLVIFGLISQGIKGQQIPPNFCLSEDEASLFRMINELRIANGASQLELSKSLSYVAQLHVRDLHLNNPAVNGCNQHSWSDKGNWVPFCYPKDQTRKKSVWDKPKELTKYPGIAYEVVYWENSSAFPDQIIENWKSTPQSANLILGHGKWNRNHWKVVGVAIFKGYACAWFGESVDPEEEIRICHSDSVISFKVEAAIHEQQNGQAASDAVIAKKTGRFYIISGSFNNLKQAQATLKDVRKLGYKRSCIIENDGKYRVSIDDFETVELAKSGRKKIANKFRDAWILSY